MSYYLRDLGPLNNKVSEVVLVNKENNRHEIVKIAFLKGIKNCLKIIDQENSLK